MTTGADQREPWLGPRVVEGRQRVSWVITDGKAGSNSQAIGVAEALGLPFDVKLADPTGIYKLLAPFGPLDPRARFGQPDSTFAPPWPAVAIAIGRRSIPLLKAVKRASPETFTVAMLDSKAGLGAADLIWVPEHDRLRGPNVIKTPTPPHGFSPLRLAGLRAVTPPSIAALPRPRYAILIGGRNGVFHYTDADDRRFAQLLRDLAATGSGLMMTTSRRTHPALAQAAEAAMGTAVTEGRCLLYQGTGDNPYPHFLAHADRIVVTADSISMAGEAAATGRPVFVFHPSRGSAKFNRFHEGLERCGVACRLDKAALARADWVYEPLDSTMAIAAEIKKRALINQRPF
ncbi:MAG: mitochondrial fission ELM1 family protein [Hyphomicrobiaceae bacterium]